MRLAATSLSAFSKRWHVLAYRSIDALIERGIGACNKRRKNRVDRLQPDEVVLDAGTTTDVLKELFDYEVESDDFDTIARAAWATVAKAAKTYLFDGDNDALTAMGEVGADYNALFKGRS